MLVHPVGARWCAPPDHLPRHEETMPIIAQFQVKGATAAKYDEVIRRLTTMGLRVPDGQLYHVCYGDQRQLQVIDVYESQVKLDAFGAKLMPLLQEFGIEASVTVSDVYSVIATE
jgi:hypothetical protein